MLRDDTNEEPIALRQLVFQMYEAGYGQAEIAAYVKKATATINTMLKPLQKKKTREQGKKR